MTTVEQATGAPRDAITLAESYAFCKTITQKQARNFYYGLKLLPEPKRSAMYAMYAYMRMVDDIADDDAGTKTIEQRRQALDHWESMTHEAVNGALPTGEALSGEKMWPAFAEMVRTYNVPLKVFEAMIAGQRQDLAGPTAMPDFAALYDYCYRVASVVGVASLYVFGFSGGEGTLELGVKRGVAFQLTNILRDVREDAERGRCYFPADEMARLGVSAGQLAEGKSSKGLMEMMRFNIERAEGFYGESAALERFVEADARPTLGAMTAIYHGLLEKIAANPGRVLKGRVRLSPWRKLAIAWQAMRRE